jgi:hypothetical protein
MLELAAYRKSVLGSAGPWRLIGRLPGGPRCPAIPWKLDAAAPKSTRQHRSGQARLARRLGDDPAHYPETERVLADSPRLGAAVHWADLASSPLTSGATQSRLRL